MNKFVPYFFLVLLAGGIAEAKLKKSHPAPPPAPTAEAPPASKKTDDEFYRIRRIFLFPGLDDLNGILATQLDKKAAALLGANPRFELVTDSGVLRALNPEDGNYRKVSQSEAVHQETALATKADATLLVKNRNIGNKTELTMEWRDSNGTPLIIVSATIPSIGSLADQEQALEKLFAESLKQIPFRGTVSGRAGAMLTIDLGESQLQVGDLIDLGRLVSVQRHPLLKTIIKADFIKVGSARVVNVDRVLSFAEIKEETNNEYIGTNNKVIAIIPRETNAPPPPKALPVYSARDKEARPSQQLKRKELLAEEDDTSDRRLKGDFERPKARFGNIGAGPALGGISTTNTNGNLSSDYSGTGIGAFVSGEFWLTKDWSLSGDYQYQSASLSGTYAGTTPVALGSSSWKRLDVWGAYRYFPGEGAPNDSGTVISFGAGYEKKYANVAANTTYGTSIQEYSGLLLRADGDIPIGPTNHVFAGLGLVPFGSAAGLQSVTSLAFRAGWGFLLQDTLWGRVSFDYDSVNSTVLNGTNSRGDRRWAILPAVYLYF